MVNVGLEVSVQKRRFVCSREPGAPRMRVVLPELTVKDSREHPLTSFKVLDSQYNGIAKINIDATLSVYDAHADQEIIS